MNLINRYLISRFLYIWAMTLLSFIVVYTVIDFLEKIGDFISKDIPFSTISLFFLSQLPKIISLMAPVATLVGVLVTLALLARNSEIVAFKAGGISLYRLSLPFLGAALLISLLMFFLSDVVAPKTSAVANSIWQGQVRERLDTSTIIKDSWLRSVRLIQHMDSYDEATGEVLGLSMFFFDENMHLARRLEAGKGQFLTNGQLQLENVQDKQYLSQPGHMNLQFTLSRQGKLLLDNFPKPPQGFGRIETKRSEEMNAAELWQAIDRLQAEGFDPSRQKVDFHFKFSFTFISLIMAILGLPLGFWKEKGSSVAVGLSLGIGLSFVYLITLELSRSIGYSGLFPPFLAAWLPNFMFLLFGVYLFSYIRQ